VGWVQWASYTETLIEQLNAFYRAYAVALNADEATLRKVLETSGPTETALPDQIRSLAEPLVAGLFPEWPVARVTLAGEKDPLVIRVAPATWYWIAPSERGLALLKWGAVPPEYSTEMARRRFLYFVAEIYLPVPQDVPDAVAERVASKFANAQYQPTAGRIVLTTIPMVSEIPSILRKMRSISEKQ